MNRILKEAIYYYGFYSNKKKYIEIANVIQAEPFTVYRILRGKRCKTLKELSILYMLKEKGFIRRIKYKYK